MDEDLPMTNWMWIPKWELADQTNARLVLFRRKITLTELLSEYCIQLSADSKYKLYVNGVFAEVGPSKGDRYEWFFDTVDIAPYLNIGNNVIALEVLRYPNLHYMGNQGTYRTDTPGLYINSVKVPDNCEDISADEKWQCCMHQGFSIVSESPDFAPLHILEERTGDALLEGWKSSGYDAGKWEKPHVYCIYEISQTNSPGNLVSRTISYMEKKKNCFTEVYGRFESNGSKDNWNQLLHNNKPVTIPAGSHEVIEINAGEIKTAFLSLRLAGGKDSEIKILCSEGYVQKNKIASQNEKGLPLKGDRMDCENGYLHGFTDIYHVCGYGIPGKEELFEPFWFRTFRFVQMEIEAGNEPLIITGFDFTEVGYPLQEISHVVCSDESLSAIWDISLRSLKRCMHETYEDCPFYEQLQYAMDSRSQILYTYMVSGDDRLARRCMEDFRKSQRYDGLINCSAPCYEVNVIPGFSIYYIMMLYDHMMYFGEKDILRRHIATVDGILEYFHRSLDERGLVGKIGGLNTKSPYWSFIDWAPEWDATTGVPPATLYGPITMESLLYVYGLNHAAEISDYIGRKETAEEYRDRAVKVKEAILQYCTGQDGMIMDGPGIEQYSQHCQVFAALTDTVKLHIAGKNLLRSMEQKESYAQCSVAMAFYLYRALEKTDLYQHTDKCWNIWRKMLANNLTTCVEDDIGSRSDCHAWGALALYELPAVILGVRPVAPGYKEIKVHPVPGYLEWAKGQVITKQGLVEVEWKKNAEGGLEVNYSINKESIR